MSNEKSLTISANPVGVWAGSQLSMLKAEQRGFWTTHRDDEKRFIVRADEMLTAFVELQRAIPEFAVSLVL